MKVSSSLLFPIFDDLMYAIDSALFAANSI